MIFALLGDIILGDAVWTGPTTAKETRKAAIAEHKVARGKPPLQDAGDDNDTKSLDFFWDETFCDAEIELAKLQAAFATRLPLPLVSGDGSFNGVRWLIEEMSVDTLKTTPFGRPVRMKVNVKLKECPAQSPLTFFEQIARAGAAALGAIGVGNMGARK